MNENEFFEDYYKKGKDAWEIFTNKIRAEKFYERVKKTKSYLNSLDNKKLRILDVGCGEGFFSKELGYDNIIGIDVSFQAAIRAKNSIEKVFVGNAVKLPFKDESFDVVLCMETLYYHDKNLMMHELHRVIKKNGHLILSLGNKDNIKKILYKLISKKTEEDVIYSKNKKSWSEKRYSSKELKKLIETSGFEILKYSGILFDLPVLSRYAVIRKFLLFPLSNLFKDNSNQIIIFARKK
ncbi:Ubiquinone biosynthesis O-methyltransferase [Candidatus Tiddalikarchaeum anstoanum]|nr:Ubiquinone biosynthesis O-methyltransferase [Candidatus Tiddalikarchaeum anstoanum]